MEKSVFSNSHTENETTYSFKVILQTNSKCELDYETSNSKTTSHENYKGTYTTLVENPLTVNCHFTKLVLCEDDQCNMLNVNKEIEIKIENNIPLFKKGNPIISLDKYQY